EERARERETDIAEGYPSGRRLLLQGAGATLVVIGGCTVLVHAALYLAPRFDVPREVVGTFGLAILTSLPNAWVALTLARRRRGAVLMSAISNSNTINVVFGICMPALFHAWNPSHVVQTVDIPALLLLSLLSLALVWRGRGLGRPGGVVLMLVYAVFVALRLR
ncbi:MAG TPA: hypothetical protein VHB98_11965, partial [Chloroflexota bacterium]|nr:hypothetical protein [Chloroflexota bacterium]